MKYLYNLLVAIDQLGNALCGGFHDNTISARMGYFSVRNKKKSRYFWKTLEFIIDTTFWPVDGPDHCKEAFFADPHETFYDNKGDFMRVLMSVIVIAVCIPISMVLYTGWLVSRPFIKKKKRINWPHIACKPYNFCILRLPTSD